MNNDKRQLYFTLSEQQVRLEQSMSDVLVQYKKFLKAKKAGKLKIEQQTKGIQLFNV